MALPFQTTAGGASTLDQMRGDQLPCLLARQLQQWEHRLQQITDIGCRERRQYLNRQLACQFGIAQVGFAPIQLFNLTSATNHKVAAVNAE